jgi:hypothetical protein
VIIVPLRQNGQRRGASVAAPGLGWAFGSGIAKSRRIRSRFCRRLRLARNPK